MKHKFKEKRENEIKRMRWTLKDCGSEANAEEAPDFKEAEKDKDSYMRSWEPEANALSSMRFHASLIFCLTLINTGLKMFKAARGGASEAPP